MKLEKRKKLFIYSFILNSFVLIFYLVFFDCQFETNDDFIMKLISSGGYGKPDEHIIYINVIIGYILKWLYLITNKIPWYELFQYLFIYFSLSMITFVIYIKSQNKIERYFKLFIAILLSYFVYVNLQFTKTAAILAVSGYITIEFSIYENNKKMSIVGIILVTLSSLMRFQMFLAVSTICASLFIPIIINKIKSKNNQNINKQFLNLGKIVIISLCFVMIGQIVDKNAYNTDDWNYYTSFNKCRGELYDDGFPNYDENIEMYNRLDINENALYLYRNGKYNDSDKFSLETLKEIIANKKDFLYKFNIFSFIDDVYYFFIGNNKVLPYTIILVAIVLYYLLFNRNKEYIYAVSIFLLLTIVSLICYFIRNNEFQEKVFTMFMITASILFLYKLEVSNIYRQNLLLIIIISLVFISNNSFIDSLKISNYSDEKNEYENDYEEILEYMNNNKENFYIFRYDIGKLFEIYEYGCFNNIIQPGNWIMNAPMQNEIEENYNLKNIFKDIIGSNYGYIVENISDDKIKYIDDYVQYINDYYCETAYSEKVFNTKYYAIYKILK